MWNGKNYSSANRSEQTGLGKKSASSLSDGEWRMDMTYDVNNVFLVWYILLIVHASMDHRSQYSVSTYVCSSVIS